MPPGYPGRQDRRGTVRASA